MSKGNAFALLEPERDIEERTWEIQGQPFTFWLAVPDWAEIAQANDLGERLIADYLGAPDLLGGKRAAPKKAFPPVAGVAVTDRLSEHLLRTVARVVVMQDAPDASDLYTAEELIVLALRAREWWEIAGWATERFNQALGAVGNASAAREETSSAPRSRTEDAIPSSIGGRTPSSGA